MSISLYALFWRALNRPGCPESAFLPLQKQRSGDCDLYFDKKAVFLSILAFGALA
jgi:hypothetical protein